MLKLDVRDLAAHYKKVRVDYETLRKQNMELAGGKQNKVAHATVEFALLKAVTEELFSVKSKSAAIRVESANSR